MKNGIYQYEQGNNPYDEGKFIVEVKTTAKSVCLKIVKKEMRFSTYVDLLFGEKTKININLERNAHGFNAGEEWFVIYPQRRGIPLSFVLGNEVST